VISDSFCSIFPSLQLLLPFLRSLSPPARPVNGQALWFYFSPIPSLHGIWTHAILSFDYADPYLTPTLTHASMHAAAGCISHFCASLSLWSLIMASLPLLSLMNPNGVVSHIYCAFICILPAHFLSLYFTFARAFYIFHPFWGFCPRFFFLFIFLYFHRGCVLCARLPFASLGRRALCTPPLRLTGLSWPGSVPAPLGRGLVPVGARGAGSVWLRQVLPVALLLPLCSLVGR